MNLIFSLKFLNFESLIIYQHLNLKIALPILKPNSKIRKKIKRQIYIFLSIKIIQLCHFLIPMEGGFHRFIVFSKLLILFFIWSFWSEDFHNKFSWIAEFRNIITHFGEIRNNLVCFCMIHTMAFVKKHKFIKTIKNFR